MLKFKSNYDFLYLSNKKKGRFNQAFGGYLTSVAFAAWMKRIRRGFCNSSSLVLTREGSRSPSLGGYQRWRDP